MSDAWVAAFTLLALLSIVNAVVLVATLRQVGVLHLRVRPTGAGQHEGPQPGNGLPHLSFEQVPTPGAAAWRPFRAQDIVLAYVSPGCELCHTLVRSIEAIRPSARDFEFAFVTNAAPDEALTWAATTNPGAPLLCHPRLVDEYRIPGSPYVLALRAGSPGEDLVVLASGVTNTLEQVEDLLAEARRQRSDEPVLASQLPAEAVTVVTRTQERNGSLEPRR